MTERKGNFILFYSTKSIYSNFHPAEFTDQELMRNLPESSEFFGQKDFRFSHVEQYMHACKAMLFLDFPVLDQILSTSDPKEAKELGRKVANFDDKVWTATARDIVTRGCVLKFGQNEELRQLMEDDGKDRQFVECAPRDRRWGIGLGMKNPKCIEPRYWRGQNWLGKCLDNAWKYLDEGTEPRLLKCFGSGIIPKVENSFKSNANTDSDIEFHYE